MRDKIRASALFIIAVLFSLFPLVMFSGCSGEAMITVESLLTVDSGFSGTRIISMTLPNDMDQNTLISTLTANCPKSKNGAFKLRQNGGKVDFEISFTSQAEYIQAVETLLKREVSVCYAKLDNLFTVGTRLEEDFDISELTEWISDAIKNSGIATGVTFNFFTNLVNINGETLPTDKTISVNNVTGHEILGISLNTVNNKDGTYSRRFTFEIGQETFDELGEQVVKDFFKERTDDSAQYAQWTRKGSIREYEVTFGGLDIETLSKITNKILGVSDCRAVYGDITNSSTPFTENLVYEERLNFFAFMGKNKSAVPIQYMYSLPAETTFGIPVVLQKGVWQNIGDKINGAFNLEFDQSMLYIHVPDGMEYKVDEIRITLENKGNNQFIRTFDVIYGKDSGEGAIDYAVKFFAEKDVDVSKRSENNSEICRVVFSGNAEDINKQIKKIFGSSNSFGYNKTEKFFAVANFLEISESINLEAMLSAKNPEVPIKYTAISNADEAISSMSVVGGGSNNVIKNANEMGEFVFELGIEGTEIKISSSLPNAGGIVIYLLIAIALVGGFVLLFLAMKKKDERAKYNARRYGATVRTYKLNLGDDERKR